MLFKGKHRRGRETSWKYFVVVQASDNSCNRDGGKRIIFESYLGRKSIEVGKYLDIGSEDRGEIQR